MLSKTFSRSKGNATFGTLNRTDLRLARGDDMQSSRLSLKSVDLFRKKVHTLLFSLFEDAASPFVSLNRLL